MPTIISRAQAGLPPVPSAVGTRSLSSWTGIKVHHTGGAFSSWRAIYDWQVRNRPEDHRLVDIGYSFGIANGRVTELRGWTRHPAHDHENSTIGVVLGGSYQNGLPSAADLDALVWFCQEARRRTSKQLKITGHRDTWPRGDDRYSTCPGDRLYAWIPTLRARVDRDEEDDVELGDKIKFNKWVNDEYGMSTISVGSGIAHGYAQARLSKDETRAYGKQILAGQAAILAKLGGQDVTAAVRAELDRAADRERAERRTELGELQDLLAEASQERAALATLVAQAQSGALDAAEVVRLIGERLAAVPADDAG